MTPVSAAAALVEVRVFANASAPCALDDASVPFARGRFHALIGENGAGKSTLVKCITGYYRADAGTILIDAAPRIMRSRRRMQLGLGLVYQHFTLSPQMTVAENLVLGSPRSACEIDWKSDIGRCAVPSGMPFPLDPEPPVAPLRQGEAEARNSQASLPWAPFSLLDEPTSVLTPGEADQVLSEMRRLADSNILTVVLITHKFREVTQFADDVSVMRGGRLLMTAQVAATSAEELCNIDVRAEREPRAARRDPAGTGYGGCLLRCPRPERVGDRGTLAVAGTHSRFANARFWVSPAFRATGRNSSWKCWRGNASRSAAAISVAGQPYRRSRSEMHRYSMFL